jgi:L-2-hydroxyglutarate oxidase
MLGKKPSFQIMPFRGEYFLLDQQHNQIVNHLIYPIPDPALPFLGVHLTKMIDGTVTVGPNAVLSFKREGYSRLAFSSKDTFEAITYPGFFKVLMKHPKATFQELRDSLCKRGYLKRVQKYAPQLKLEDLKAYPPGVRAQAITPDGKVVDDFLFENTRRALVVCNAPSPAATSAMPIAGYIVDELEKQMERID